MYNYHSLLLRGRPCLFDGVNIGSVGIPSCRLNEAVVAALRSGRGGITIGFWGTAAAKAAVFSTKVGGHSGRLATSQSDERKRLQERVASTCQNGETSGLWKSDVGERGEAILRAMCGGVLALARSHQCSCHPRSCSKTSAPPTHATRP